MKTYQVDKIYPEQLRPGDEAFSHFRAINGMGLCEYNYRHTNGVLFAVIKKTEELCRAARDNWIAETQL